MAKLLDVNEVLERPEGVALIDVRSPGEFASGHIPGAVNIPLFDDDQRAEVGTLFKQSGREVAVTRGLAIAGPKASKLVETVRRVANRNEVIVHCWRGGMRSESFAWMLRQCEIPSSVLRGGYKSFRRAAHQDFETPRSIVTLSGMSGSGKTQLLVALHESGEQVLDLEGLANHRGSAFGGIGLPPQPTVEQFENDIFMLWRSFDPTQPLWIESESQSIGRAYVPNPIFDQMVNSPAVVLDVDFEARAAFLVDVYGGFAAADFAESIEKIKKRLGGERYKAAMDAVDRNDVLQIARISLDYYDRGYKRASEKWSHRVSETVRMPLAGDVSFVDQLKTISRRLVTNDDVTA